MPDRHPVCRCSITGKKAYTVEHITTDDGLPASKIFAIHQDDFGFLWLGTDRGLVQYDGVLFKSYTHIEGDSTSLAGREVVGIQEDAEGNFWLGTDEGISYFNRQTERFENYSNPPTLSILISPSDPEILWVADAALSKFYIPTRSFEVIESHEKYSVDSIFNAWAGRHGLVEDDRGVVWAGVGWGIFQYDTTTKTLQRHFPDPRYPDLSSDTWFPGARNDTGSLLIPGDEQDALWGTAMGGLFRVDRRNASIEMVPYGPQDGLLAGDLPYGKQVSAFHIGLSGTFWIGMRDGLYTFNRKTRQFTLITPRHLDFRINSIFEDGNGAVWIGSGDGLQKVSTSRFP